MLDVSLMYESELAKVNAKTGRQQVKSTNYVPLVDKNGNNSFKKLMCQGGTKGVEMEVVTTIVGLCYARSVEGSTESSDIGIWGNAKAWDTL